jgi:hypothetical protein
MCSARADADVRMWISASKRPNLLTSSLLMSIAPAGHKYVRALRFPMAPHAAAIGPRGTVFRGPLHRRWGSDGSSISAPTETTPFSFRGGRAAPPLRDRKFADSSVEQAGFDPSVRPHRRQLPKPRRRGRWKPPVLPKGANIEMLSLFRLVRNAGTYDRLLTKGDFTLAQPASPREPAGDFNRGSRVLPRPPIRRAWSSQHVSSTRRLLRT